MKPFDPRERVLYLFKVLLVGFLFPSLAYGANGALITTSPCTSISGNCLVNVTYSAYGSPVYCIWNISAVPKYRWTCQGYSSYSQAMMATTSPITLVLKAQQDWGDNSDATFNAGQTLDTKTIYAQLPAINPQSQSRYLSLGSDVLVDSVNKVLLQTTFNLSQADNVLFRTDGRYYPSFGSVAANIYIKLNGNPISNNSTIDWRGSTSAQQHSFNAIGSAYLPAGTHTVQLLGSVTGGSGSFQVGAGSNLSIFVHPSDIVSSSETVDDSAVISLDTSNWSDLLQINPSAITQNYNIPYVNLASVTTTAFSDVIALSSGYAHKYLSSGDAFLSIFANGKSPGNNYASWAMQDLWEGAESKAPFYSHAIFQNLQINSNVALIATEAPWGPPEQASYDGVSYRVGSKTKWLIAD